MARLRDPERKIRLGETLEVYKAFRYLCSVISNHALPLVCSNCARKSFWDIDIDDAPAFVGSSNVPYQQLAPGRNQRRSHLATRFSPSQVFSVSAQRPL